MDLEKRSDTGEGLEGEEGGETGSEVICERRLKCFRKNKKFDILLLLRLFVYSYLRISQPTALHLHLNFYTYKFPCFLLASEFLSTF